ncbi:MAG: DUF1642 domain-containing protein [Bacilli bacterium]|nr:DUF1642 domain-containing protein [Bacilli bacterium]
MMKTIEFVKKVEALGYEVSYSWGTIYIKRAGFMILDLGYVEEWDIDIDYPGFDEMRWYDKKELMTIVSEYMLTDPTDREEEKRYRVKFPGIKRDGKNIYIMRTYNSDGTQGIDLSPEEYIFNDYPGAYLFTEKEIKSMNEHYWHFAEEATE